MDDSADLPFLNCYICFEQLKKPKMCPSCSKVACQKCLRAWIQQKRPECPYCGQSTLLSNFVQCERFISDIKNVLDASQQRDKIKQRCKQHKIEMSYYCQDCQESICSDCGMFGIRHRNHKITHLKKIYQQYRNKISNQLTKFDHKIQGFRNNGYHIKLSMQKLITMYKDHHKFVQDYFLNILQNLSEQLKEKQDKITWKYQKNSKQIQFLQNFRQDIYKQLQASSQQQLIVKSESLIKDIKALHENKIPDIEQIEHKFQTMYTALNYRQRVLPKQNEFQYILKNYLQTQDTIIYSQPYIQNGLVWKLKIYPRGNAQGKDTHISVFLQLSQGLVNGNQYQYKIQLINYKKIKNSLMRQYCSSFYIQECWGYNQFILISDLDKGYLTDNGQLIFNVSVRNPSYKSLVNDQNTYINYLQQKLNSLPNPQDDEIKIPKKADNKMNQLTKLSKEAKQNIKKILMNDEDRQKLSNIDDESDEQINIKQQQQQDKSLHYIFKMLMKQGTNEKNNK